jgi:uncharacterized spore protein YtfJ
MGEITSGPSAGLHAGDVRVCHDGGVTADGTGSPVGRRRSTGSADPDAGRGAGGLDGQQVEEALEVDVDRLLAQAADNLAVRRAFGTAYERDGVLIIPVAIVAGGGGAGTRRGRIGPGEAAAGGGGAPGEGGAVPGTGARDPGQAEAGGGFGGLVLPSGAYVVKDGQVRWVPAVDVTIAVLASLSLARMLARTWTRQRRRRQP